MPEVQYAPDPRPVPNLSILSRRLGCDCPFSAELLAGLIHYWKLEEASGNIRLDSVGTDNLSEQIGTVGQTAGKHGNAANWVPSTGFLSNGLFSLLFSPLSCALWINVDNLPASNANILALNGDDPDPQVRITNTGNLILFNGATGDIVTMSAGTLDAWHLVVITVLGTAWKMSIDGGIFNSGTGNNLSAVHGITFGEPTTLDAAIDELAIWNRVLTQQEVTSLWNSGNGRFLI